MDIKTILLYAELVIAILLALVIVMQPKSSSGMGSMSGEAGESFSTRRGAEKFLHTVTVVLAVLFAGVAFIYHLV